MSIEMDVVPERTLEAPDFGLMIYTIEGLLCYATNTTLDSVVSEPMSGPATVAFEIAALHLHEGRSP